MRDGGVESWAKEGCNDIEKRRNKYAVGAAQVKVWNWKSEEKECR